MRDGALVVFLRRQGGILLLLLAFTVLAAIYSAEIPFFEGPDAGAHFRYVAYLHEQRRLPVYDADAAAVSHQLIQQPPLYYGLVALLTAPLHVDLATQVEIANPYFEKTLSQRATATPPMISNAASLPLHVARGVSTLGGVLTVLATWLLLSALQPNRPWMALAAAGIVAFNPQFLFSAATITNDTWTAALITLTVWLGAVGLRQPERRWVWLAAGACAGLASLTKYSSLLVAAPLALLLLWRLPSDAWRGLAIKALLTLAGFLLVAGAWYGRNLWLVGEPVPLSILYELVPGIARARPLALDGDIFLRDVRWLLRSYWGVFGYGVIAPADYHWVIQNLLAIALLGLCALPIRWAVDRRERSPLTLALALVWFGVMFVALLSWIRTVFFANQGRLLFTAAPAIAILLLLGWRSLLPRALHAWLYRIVVVVFLVLALSQIETLREAYRLPPALPADARFDRPLDARFAGGMRVLGVDLPQGAAVAPGHPMPLTIYFAADQEIDDFYTLFIHLATADDQLLYQFDGVPRQGRHATRQWVPGQAFADSYLVTVGEDAPQGLATLSLGFYDYRDPDQRQALLGPDGHPLADRLVVGQVRLADDAEPSGSPVEPPVAAWQQGIELAAADLDLDEDGSTYTLSLTWQATENVHTDYSVFVQALDAEGRLVAQVDRQPQDGQAPTSTWQAGRVVEDRVELTVPDGEAAQIIVGLYDAAGVRLPLADGSGDYFVVGR